MKAVFTLVAAVVGMVLTQGAVESRHQTTDYEKERLAAWSGPRLRHLFSGFELAVADLYWLRTVQYYGGQKAFAQVKEYDLVEPLVENVITLDPQFAIAYQLGATFLAEPPPLGLGRPRSAVRLLERGVGALPDNWLLRRDAALFRFEYLGDRVRAAAELSESAALPGAPFWLRTLAGDLARKSGDHEGAREIWRSLATSDLPFVQENARRNLLRLDALALVAAVQRRVDQYRHQLGVFPGSWRDLIASGALHATPRDPLGVELVLADGRVWVSRDSFLWRPDLQGAVGQ